MVTSTNDILEELDTEMKMDNESLEKIMPGSLEEKNLLSYLANEPLHLDEISRISSLSVSEVSSRLTVMELKGIVKNLGGGVFKKR